jgi:hypothetical protein
MRFNPIGNEFAALVEGIDLCAPLNSAQVATIHAGMGRHAVLVFHDQPLTDEQQIAFTRSLGKIELNTANNITRLDQRRLRPRRGSLLRPRQIYPGRSEISWGPMHGFNCRRWCDWRCRRRWGVLFVALHATNPIPDLL